MLHIPFPQFHCDSRPPRQTRCSLQIRHLFMPLVLNCARPLPPPSLLAFLVD
ncbi:hypothetical protein BC940DRAFT_62453 [Gongronella butleri]|nr:hypothetical protein BC940DRAFT_62453 [Gongronella butleri]